MSEKLKVLWVGDANCQSGFAKGTHGICDQLLIRGWDVHVLGVNHFGDPHSYPYPIWSCLPGGDYLGVNRLPPLALDLKPDVIVIQSDVWLIPPYMERLKRIPELQSIPVVGSLAVDGKNSMGGVINTLTAAAFWTQFGMREAALGDFERPSTVIPLGIDLSVFSPMDRREARAAHNIVPGHAAHDGFIVLNVNRNQLRKRLDLTIQYFAEWVKSYNVKDAFLMLHACPTGDEVIRLHALATYYGIKDRTFVSEPVVNGGPDDEGMRKLYNIADVQVTTSVGEGFGLTTLEGMACGIPQIVPDFSALGEWASAAKKIPCYVEIAAEKINTIGGIADRDEFIVALDDIYRDEGARELMSHAGLRLAANPRFTWADIGQKWDALLHNIVLQSKMKQDEEDVVPLGR